MYECDKWMDEHRMTAKAALDASIARQKHNRQNYIPTNCQHYTYTWANKYSGLHQMQSYMTTAGIMYICSSHLLVPAK